ncbi:MAG: redoxin domain-containing protein [Acidobacteria bacterium]|nr:redoxin domain-containing protein [Acidobacteriota bacterium]
MRLMFSVLAAALAAAAAVAQSPAPVELKVGDRAPAFSLQGTDGKVHALSDYAGKRAVVVAWFPAAFTSGCTIECKSLAEHGDLIRKYDVQYFMASVDSAEKNAEFAKATSVMLNGQQVMKAEADFPLLSDSTKAVAAAYGVLNARGVANRWTFYIGKDGRILAIDKAVKPATSAEDLAAKLGELGVAKAPTD